MALQLDITAIGMGERSRGRFPLPPLNPARQIDVTGDGGVLKEVLEYGAGAQVPHPDDDVCVHYARWLREDGIELGGSYKKPFRYKLGQGSQGDVICQGCDLGVATMSRGEKSIFIIRSDYGYGDDGSGDVVPPNSELIYEVQLLRWNERDVVGDGGILLELLDEPGVPASERPPLEGQPPEGAEVLIKWSGRVCQNSSEGWVKCDGRVFATSANADQDFELVRLGRESPPLHPIRSKLPIGIDKAIRMMNKGSRALITCEPRYTIVESGRNVVPSGVTVQFELELHDWNTEQNERDERARARKEEERRQWQAAYDEGNAWVKWKMILIKLGPLAPLWIIITAPFILAGGVLYVIFVLPIKVCDDEWKRREAERAAIEAAKTAEQRAEEEAARARKEEERRQWQARVMSPIFAMVYVCRNVMSAIGYFRSYCMRTQLLLSFGLTVVFVFASFIGIWGWSVIHLRDSVTNDSKKFLRKQIALIGTRITSEVKDVFQATMAQGASCFLYPVAFGLFDAFDASRKYSIAAVPSYPARNLADLRAPLTFDTRTDEFGSPQPSFVCQRSDKRPSGDSLKDLCSNNQNGENSQGCLCDGKKKLSTTASSAFVTGMTSANAAKELASFPGADVTSYMDAFVQQAWHTNPDWIQVYLGVQHDEVDKSLFRSFPGFVHEYGEMYNAGSRPWYTAAAPTADESQRTRKDQLQVHRPNITLTAPYEDADGKGDVVSLTAPVTDPLGSLRGIVGVDLAIGSLRKLIGAIRTRETGEAFVFHKELNLVLASKQLVPGQKLPLISDLNLLSASSTRFSDLSKLPCSEICTDMKGCIASEHGVLLVWRGLWDDKYCLVIVTDVQEIEYAIISQLEQIETSSNLLLWAIVAVCIISASLMFVVVLVLAQALSQPLSSTAEDSKLIVSNIGGNHSQVQGLDRDKNESGVMHALQRAFVGNVGEVRELRQRFDVLLNDLLKKREKSLGSRNPFCDNETEVLDFHSIAAYAFADSDEVGTALQLPAVGPDIEVAVNVRDGAGDGCKAEFFESPMTSWNTIQRQLLLKLILPLFLVLVGLATLSSFRLISSAKTWVEPVQDVMIREELMSLDTRLSQRAESLRQELIAGKNTVSMVKAYWLQLLDGTSDSWNSSKLPPLIRGEGVNPTYFSPYSPQDCTRGSGIDQLIKCGTELSLIAEKTTASAKLESYEDRMISVEASAFFRPKSSLEDKKLMPADNDQVFSFSSSVEEVAHLADLDNVMRVAYFSIDVTAVYLGMHSTETFKHFPFQDQTSYNSEQICDSKLEKPPEKWVRGQGLMESEYKSIKTQNYNPVCRPWYQRAQRNAPRPPAGSSEQRGDVVFNPIDFAAGTDLPYLALSSSVWIGADQTQMVGVVSIDLNIASLRDTLNQTDLYKNGYVLVWDDNGMAVIHKSLKSGLPRYDIAWVDATAGGKFKVDENWMTAQKLGMFDKGRVAGNFNFTFEGRVWYYTFMPIPDTPYMISLSVVLPEVTKTADDLFDRLMQEIMLDNLIVGVVLGCSCLLLVWFAVWFNRHVGKPVKELADFVGIMKELHYAHDLPKNPQGPGSKELEEIDINLERMLVALRFGDARFSNGDRDRELDNCIKALDITLELGNERGKGICYNNMANCLRALQKKYEEADAQAGTLGGAVEQVRSLVLPLLAGLETRDQPALGEEQVVPFGTGPAGSVLAESGQTDAEEDKAPDNPDGPGSQTVEPETSADWIADGLYQLAIEEAENGSSTKAMRVFNRALFLVSKQDEQFFVQGVTCLQQAADDCADVQVLMSMAWAAVKDLQAHLFGPRYAPVLHQLQTMCQRAGARLADVGSGPGITPELFTTAARMCAVECYLNYHGNETASAACAYWALKWLPRMSHELLIFFVYHVKMSAARQGACCHTFDGEKTLGNVIIDKMDHILKKKRINNKHVGAVPELDVWQYLEYIYQAGSEEARNKDVIFCIDISGSMGFKTNTGNTRLFECKAALRQLLAANILKIRDRFGLKVFDDKTDTLIGLTDNSPASLKRLNNKIDAMEPRGETMFYTAIQECLSELGDSVEHTINSAGALTGSDQWVVALTDGETRDADSDAYKSILSRLEKKEASRLNLICIIVGANKQGHLIDALEAACDETNQVIHLQVGTDDISAAFKQVGEIISGGGGLSEDL